MRELYTVEKILIADIKRSYTDQAKQKELLDILEKPKTNTLFAEKAIKVLGKAKPNSPSNTLPLSYQQVMEAGQTGSVKLVDIFVQTHALCKIPDNTEYDHWFFGWAPFLRDNVKRPLARAAQWVVHDVYDVKLDNRLLATLGGKEIEDAAEKLMQAVCTLYPHGLMKESKQGVMADFTTAKEYVTQFYDNAKIIIEYAEKTLENMKNHGPEHSIKRMNGIVNLFKKQ